MPKLVSMMTSNQALLAAHQPETWSQAAWPLGAHHDSVNGLTTFAVYAPEAQHVTLEIYSAALGADAVFTVAAAYCPDGIWRVQLSGAGHGTLYAYRCWGRNWPFSPDWTPGSTVGFVADRDQDHNHFNPNKVLLDPYAREVTHTTLSPALKEAGGDPFLFGTGGHEFNGQIQREIDTGRWAPKGIVIVDDTSTGNYPERAEEDATIYEVHTKHLSMHPSASRIGDLLGAKSGFEGLQNIPEDLRGTYAGAALMAPYLRGIGMNTIELLPVHITDSDQVGQTNGTTNNWGYQTLNFFSPNPDYAADKSPGGPTREFKEMVRAFHDEGISVYIDVVYNHTSEGGNWYGDPDSAGFTTLGGFATAEYYDLTGDGFVQDGATGSSNQTNFSSTAMSQLVVDSLIYWHHQMGIDGFRFDLATVLGRMPDLSEVDDWNSRKRFFMGHPLLTRIGRLAEQNDFEVIAEAWDLWGYEVGNFPAEWGEWNGRFRDAMRGFLKGDGNTEAFMNQFNGDWWHFSKKQGPQKSVNFITAHDGFTMIDLVSFNEKDNAQPYPFGPSDGGADQNLSWDSGGDKALRRTRWRNFMTTLFFSRGVPMVVGGDEYCRTQNGNNNPWNLNTVGMWNNWAQTVSNSPTLLPVDPRDENLPGYYDVVGATDTPEDINPMFEFFRYLTKLRQIDPTLRQRIWGGDRIDDNDVSYLFYKPDLSSSPEEGDRALSVLVNGEGIGGTDYLFMVNMTAETIDFAIPAEPDPKRPKLDWLCLIDTAYWAESEYNCWKPNQAKVIKNFYTLEPWTQVVLAAASKDSPLFTWVE